MQPDGTYGVPKAGGVLFLQRLALAVWVIDAWAHLACEHLARGAQKQHQYNDRIAADGAGRSRRLYKASVWYSLCTVQSLYNSLCTTSLGMTGLPDLESGSLLAIMNDKSWGGCLFLAVFYLRGALF
jgi:hypothetical protein